MPVKRCYSLKIVDYFRSSSSRNFRAREIPRLKNNSDRTMLEGLRIVRNFLKLLPLSDVLHWTSWLHCVPRTIEEFQALCSRLKTRNALWNAVFGVSVMGELKSYDRITADCWWRDRRTVLSHTIPQVHLKSRYTREAYNVVYPFGDFRPLHLSMRFG